MIVVAITHAEARSVDPRQQFRALTERGVAQVWQAADRLEAMMVDVAPELRCGNIYFERIVSSPSGKCLSTAVLFADALRKYTRTSEITVSPKLLEKIDPGEMADKEERQLNIHDLRATLSEVRCTATLLCANADLAGVLPDPDRFAALHKDGWFVSRPVLTVLEYDGTRPNEIAVRRCEMLSGGSWIST